MDTVVRYDKSLYQRLEEYNELFKETETVPDIQSVWSNYLSKTIEHTGWQAIWKMERFTCELLRIGHPAYALVYVKCIDFEQLSAGVILLAIETDTKVEENHVVPLVDLWPTKIQDQSSVLNMDTTSNALDMCRFFYKEIIMPWDYSSDRMQWLKHNLLKRIHLSYDLKQGNLSETVKDQIVSLKSKAKRLYNKIELLNKSMDNDDLDSDDDEVVLHGSGQEVVSLLVQLKRMKTIYKCLINPTTRSAFEKKEINLVEDLPEKHYFIINTCKPAKQLTSLRSLQSIDEFANLKLTILSYFNDLPQLKRTDTVLLDDSQYVVNDLNLLSGGGTLRGVYKTRKSQLEYDGDDVMLIVESDVFLTNLAITSRSAQCAVLIKGGTVIMKNCTIRGDGLHKGIVLRKGQLKIIDCTVENFHVAIVANAASSMNLRNVKVSDSTVGLMAHKNVTVNIDSCSINNCSDYGITVEDGDEFEATGPFSRLNEFAPWKLKDVGGSGNKKGDVALNRRSKLTGIPNLFVKYPDLLAKLCNDNMRLSD